jgi:hypothetical protein
VTIGNYLDTGMELKAPGWDLNSPAFCVLGWMNPESLSLDWFLA